jgi:regulatory protein
VRQRRKLTTEDQLYAAAVRSLMRRAHSVYEMRQSLERRAEDVKLVRQVLDRLKQGKMLDDARFARDFARLHASQRTQGRYRIARELRARGVPDRHIETALEEAFVEISEADLLKKKIERKLRLLRGPLDQRKRRSLYQSLLRSGFSSDLISKAMRGVVGTAAELPEFEPADDV